ncbi:MAG: transposase, partial [Planctomycetales bacterium]|nr:transposase [Planctomycetales bacterium]
MSDEQWAQITLLKESDLKTATAWAIRENFRWFWEYTDAGNAKKFFSLWYDWACESELQPIIKVANMLKKRLTNILTWFRHHIS